MLKLIWQSLTLLSSLPLWPLGSSAPDLLLLQNPPSAPTLPVCRFYCTAFGSRLVVDWHNYGHTIMALAHGPGSPVVRAARWVERTFGRGADAHFCVTEAMRRDLSSSSSTSSGGDADWGLPAAAAVSTLYDRAPRRFRPLEEEDPSSPERADFLRRMRSDLREDLFGGAADGSVGLLVSSTSWTEDEDFGILLAALDNYERAFREQADDCAEEDR